MYDPEIRMKYDLSLKEFKIYEKGENYNIFRVWMHSPIFFISERDVVDKRIEFIKDDVYYNLATSVNDDYDPPNKDVHQLFHPTTHPLVRKPFSNILFKSWHLIIISFFMLLSFLDKKQLPKAVLNLKKVFSTNSLRP